MGDLGACEIIDAYPLALTSRHPNLTDDRLPDVSFRRIVRLAWLAANTKHSTDRAVRPGEPATAEQDHRRRAMPRDIRARASR